MDKVIVEREVVAAPESSGESTGSNAIWAIAFIIVVALIAGAVYYSGILRRVPPASPSKVNVEVSQPAQAPAQPAPASNR